MKKKKVLIVDDAIFMQKVASGMLSVKYETITASSGAEALELYEKEKPDLILSDLIMPGMTGLELQQALPLLPDATAHIAQICERSLVWLSLEDIGYGTCRLGLVVLYLELELHGSTPRSLDGWCRGCRS